MQNETRSGMDTFLESICGEYQAQNRIDPADYERYNVKRGLRNADGTGCQRGPLRL